MTRGLEDAMLPSDLPDDLPSFLERFGTDEQCRAYLFQARWPDGFRCSACGHGRAWAHKARLIDECAACGKQHSLLAGTIFEQTKTGLSRWFLAIYLVTSSKGGISAMELKRQMGFGSYQTAWSWLHKIRKAMVRPERPPLTARVEADETYIGAPRPGKPGRGAGGKIKVAGAVETGRGQARGRRLGRLRLAVVADASASSLGGFLGRNVARPATVATDGWSGYGSRLPATPMRPSTSAPAGATRRCACRRSTWCSAWPSAGCSAPTTAPSPRSTCRPISTSSCSASTAAPPGASATASPA
jgi:Transposase zinc-ribbon domain/ISXO2-like transposase domain